MCGSLDHVGFDADAEFEGKEKEGGVERVDRVDGDVCDGVHHVEERVEDRAWGEGELVEEEALGAGERVA